MAEYINVTVQTTEPRKISVKPNTVTPNLQITVDPTQQNVKLSRDWAIGEGLIQNEDYSSKTWAGESKSSADLSKMYSEAASLDLNNLENRIIEYNEELNTTITEGLDNINTSVTGGVETIETLQANSIAEITTNKETALSDITTASNLGLDNIATAETNALNNIDTDLNNATNEINTNRTNTLAQISTLANTSISDINAVGKSYDNLTYRNITNCLLEIPQRIKYNLTDGTLTFKAGSVVIVPYGTEDKTSELPVGATFINDNFKVYDTQFADGKFFVWAEMIEDVPHIVQGTSTEAGVEFINLTTNSGTDWGFNGVSSGTTARTDNGYQYYTDTNFVKKHTSGVANAEVYSLPTMITSKTDGVPTQISQVFNGLGYIGSTVWVDKGVKGLIPNGRNADGTCKNIEWTPNSVYIYTDNDGAGKSSMYFGYDLDTQTVYGMNQGNWSYDAVNNTWKHVTAGIKQVVIFGSYVQSGTANSVISSFQPKQPFRAVDYNELAKTNPDYSRAISIGTTHTCPSDGYIVLVSAVAGSDGQPIAYINNVEISHFHNIDNVNVRWGGGMFKVSKGDYFACGGWNKILFIPEKGV